MEQLEDNLGAAMLELGREEMERMDGVSFLGELYPYRFIKAMNKEHIEYNSK